MVQDSVPVALAIQQEAPLAAVCLVEWAVEQRAAAATGVRVHHNPEVLRADSVVRDQAAAAFSAQRRQLINPQERPLPVLQRHHRPILQQVLHLATARRIKQAQASVRPLLTRHPYRQQVQLKTKAAADWPMSRHRNVRPRNQRPKFPRPVAIQYRKSILVLALVLATRRLFRNLAALCSWESG